ncbi:50S ribosomal protein L4 [Aeromicrobium sp. 636]|uniref:Large ribosomal subunit protein uL4 n=1 Tax=Aeromicrobium senzhongii TaxID=2663859 RepID=A0A8I0EVX9_9ACTN|nr:MULTISPECIES: 50S ribosomal protein L4 [Aeromicrobium]MBC9227401.1 50S ribosomal protein L4 [Aeromicrobium senzhongii]MCQ3999498.1 50S ribosomal protein L4 [Aeromicrobium sp. 636]MTB88190.1 50S ribosomal protein L4 [Aeromicrobium senzhongii]QNL94820.1 50S ribosomal protein L4 [Aeromicrobium senzhongii]
MAQTIDVDLPVDIFDARVSIPLMHQVVTAQLAAARQGTHDVKSRGEVRGGGKKPYRQKGTGRARQGSIRAPQYNGGGVVHGPTPRSYDQRTPKKMKAAALRGALTDRARSGRLHVVESFVTGDAPSTKAALAVVRDLTIRPRVLVVLDRDDAVTAKSLRNAELIATITFDQLNTYDVLLADDVVFTKAAFDAFVAARSAEGVDTVKLSQAVVESDAPAAKPAKKTAKKVAAQAETAPVETAPADEPKAGATKTQPYGPGSKAPLASGNAPKGHEIKGNENSKKYHTPDSQWYDQTVAEVWFDSVESAEAAGFAPAGGAEAQEEN